MDLIPFRRSQDLQVILRTRDHAAVYDHTSQVLSMQSRRPYLPPATPLTPTSERSDQTDLQDDLTERNFCPTCLRPIHSPTTEQESTHTAPNYFRLLAEAASVPGSRDGTRPGTPTTNSRSSTGRSRTEAQAETGNIDQKLQEGVEVDGYYARFFIEERKLGRGARGTVYLCQHVLNGNRLGRYAIKKIPVGDHNESLLRSLQEVHLMESLQHPNIVHYQHAWIENCKMSTFSPRVPTLHVLMMAANGGSLEDWISARSGDAASASPRPSGSLAHPSEGRQRAERLKAALRLRRSSMDASIRAQNRDAPPIGVHLLREEEIYSLLQDITSGLGFLHDRGVLHLDIKPGNVLLHWDEDAMLPRAMLSDFGSSILSTNWQRQRSGHTGTMEYVAPETLVPDPLTGNLPELSSKADIWSLGLVLHLLIFFRLPYSQVDDIDQLREEMLAYEGFKGSARMSRTPPIRPGVPTTLLRLLTCMLDISPNKRPSCAEILRAIAPGPQGTPEAHAQDTLSLFPRGPFSSAGPSWQGGGQGQAGNNLPPPLSPPLSTSSPSPSSSPSLPHSPPLSPLSPLMMMGRRLSLTQPGSGAPPAPPSSSAVTVGDTLTRTRTRSMTGSGRTTSNVSLSVSLTVLAVGAAKALKSRKARPALAILLALFKIWTLETICTASHPRRSIFYPVLILALLDVALVSQSRDAHQHQRRTPSFAPSVALLFLHFIILFGPFQRSVCVYQ